MRTVVVLTASLIVVTLALGCSDLASPSRGGGKLYVTREAVIPDLPVPEGFSMDLNRSYYNSGRGTRTGLLTYVGKAETVDLLAFFRDNMPISGWQLKKESSDFGSYNLHFIKKAEAADVKIIPGRFSTDVTVSLHRVDTK
jgi:hypothetical protein